MRAACIEAPRIARLFRPDTRIVERPGWLQLATPSTPGTYLNEIVFSELEPDAVDEVVDREIGRCRAERRPLKWCVGPWTRPHDFGERLAARGFDSWEVRGMGIASDAPITTAEDVVALEVGPDELEDWVRVSLHGWSMPAELQETERVAIGAALSETPRVVHLFAARDAATGEWLATSAVFVCAAYGYLVGGQVLEHARGRGAYKALVAARLALLRAHAIPFAVTQARAATSAPILARLGFTTLFESKCYVLSP
jgi:hypothetical protein